MMLALRNASPAQTFLIRAHTGDYSLFLSGIFPGTVQRRSDAARRISAFTRTWAV